jgi:hypothetical protein
MTTQTLNIETATKSEIIIAATIQPELMKSLGGLERIKNTSEDQLRFHLEMYFAFNNEVGAFYDKNGF